MITLQEIEDRLIEWNAQACVAVSAKDPSVKEFGANAGDDEATPVHSVRLAFAKAIAAALQPDREDESDNSDQSV